MSNILLLAHTDADGALPKPALEAAAAAKELAAASGATLSVGLFGAGAAQACQALAGSGASAYFAVSGDAFAAPRYASDLAAAVVLADESGADYVIAPATSRVSRIAAGLGQRLGGVADTQVTGLEVVDGKIVATRWFYRQRMSGQVSRTARTWVLTLQPGAVAPLAAETGSVEVKELEVAAPESRTTVLGVQAPSADSQTIRPEAEVLFVAGAGWTKKQPDGNMHLDAAGELILGFVDAAKASLGSSKSLVDMGGEGQKVLPFLTHLHQVGQTGSTPRHAKGLATCCHGEEPHVVGWRFVPERRAVNLDANCGWARGKADVLYVADAFAIVRLVNQLLAG